MKNIILLLLSVSLFSCAHSIPYKDQGPDQAGSQGYYLSGDQARSRGGIAGYVPRQCSNGGWGAPSDCAAPAKAQAPAMPAAIAKDSDGDGVLDAYDQCKDTPKGTEVNPFGCPVGQKVEINLNVQFPSGSAKLNTNYVNDLNKVAKVLADNPDLKVRIEGHTDSLGDATANQKLSESRAASVSDYLKSHGAKEDQVASAGFGSSRPVADNKTAAGRKQNRRVTAVVVE